MARLNERNDWFDLWLGTFRNRLRAVVGTQKKGQTAA